MPRGIPNAKRDETGMKWTTYNVPLGLNPKHLGSSYLKSESQTLWSRNAAKGKNGPEDELAMLSEQRRGTNTIVILPGSRYLRMGRASDTNPVVVPNVIARKSKPPISAPTYIECVTRPSASKSKASDEDDSEDSVESKVSAITYSLRERMRFYKLDITPDASSIAAAYNSTVKPEIIPEENDPFRIEWLDETCTDDVLVGEKALRLLDPQKAMYQVRWPIYGDSFNTRDCTSLQVLLGDIETIFRHVLKEELDINANDYKNYSVVLVVPDFYDKLYLKELSDLLLARMGMKQLCVQQESLAATYGAGVSNACVVNIGSVNSTVSCVEEGVVLPETRLSLNIGGDDITDFLHYLLHRIDFPYREMDLAKSYHWAIMEDIKVRLCTLAEGDVAGNMYDFVARQPGRPSEKYTFRAYDEVITAPMCLFEPRVIEFDRKWVALRSLSNPDVADEIVETTGQKVTQAMIISTQHLNDMPSSGDLQPAGETSSSHDVGATEENTNEEQANDNDAMAVDGQENIQAKAGPKGQAKSNQEDAPVAYPTPHGIDICFEASKLPLDVAIFNSARSAGGDEKIRKFFQAVLVIGGSALIPGMSHALESRLQAIATPLIPKMDKVQILSAPKDVDLRVLAWKGASVLARMDGVNELWVTRMDWDILGIRGLKERCFYL